MNSVSAVLGQSHSAHPLRLAFLRWQCRVRQVAMRENEGRPDDAITPALFLPEQDQPLGHIITVMNKSPGYSVLAELNYMDAQTNDPAQKREKAMTFFSAGYYQGAAEFSDILTATFPPGSPGAAQIREAGQIRLVFDAYNQIFDISAKVWRLAEHNPLSQATIAHNRLFNAAFPPDTEVLGFEPDWSASASDPAFT
jgi:hypothetical protein